MPVETTIRSGKYAAFFILKFMDTDETNGKKFGRILLRFDCCVTRVNLKPGNEKSNPGYLECQKKCVISQLTYEILVIRLLFL